MSDDIKLLYELQLLYNKEAELKKVSKESFINFQKLKKNSKVLNHKEIN